MSLDACDSSLMTKTKYAGRPLGTGWEDKICGDIIQVVQMYLCLLRPGFTLGGEFTRCILISNETSCYLLQGPLTL